MARASLLYADTDDFFSDRFGQYLLEHNNYFEMISFTSMEYLKQYLQKNRFDVLLVDKGFASDEEIDALSSYGTLILILDDSDFETEKYYHIGKYQKMENIIKEVTFRYAEVKGDRNLITSKSSSSGIISVYSPVGGSGKTTIAVALAGVMAKYGKNVVYLNLEKFNSADALFNAHGKEGLSDIFLKLKNNSKDISFEIVKRMIDNECGFKYFAPVESAEEFYEMTDEEIENFIHAISGISDIDYIIVDLPTEYNYRMKRIMKFSEMVLLIANDSEFAAKKIELFMHEFEIIEDMQPVKEKIIPVFNKTALKEIPEKYSKMFEDNEFKAVIPRIGGMEVCSRADALINAIQGFIADVVRIVLSR